MIEDQSAQIFSGLSIVEGLIPSHHLSDIIFKLSMEPAGQRISGMGHAIAGLCGWKSRLAREPEACVEFVNRRQEVYGTKGTRWDSSEDDYQWVKETSILSRGGDVFYSGMYSGITPMSQAVTSDYSHVASSEGTPTIPFFDWYPAKDHLEMTARRAMDKEVFDGNLRWNSRVIVMDLLFLLEESRDSDPAKTAKTTALLKQMFRVDLLPKDPRYESFRANKSTSLWLFFVHFWEPALANFRKVFKSGSKDQDQEAKAVGEVCLVLGITCRTQWMQIGFLHSLSFRNYASDEGAATIEYLPCRFDRLLSLLHERHSESLQTFVREMKEIFDILIARQVEANFETALFPPPRAGFNPLESAKSKAQNYVSNTRHFLLNESFYARHPPPPPPKNGCDDPRKTTNVYLFALLDVS